jgi:hypothetical protein
MERREVEGCGSDGGVLLMVKERKGNLFFQSQCGEAALPFSLQQSNY